MSHFFVYFDLVFGRSYDGYEPAEINEQVEQFRRDPCDQECVDDCFKNNPGFDCEFECGCA